MQNKYQNYICNYIKKTYKATTAVEDNKITIHILPYNLFIEFEFSTEDFENYCRLKGLKKDEGYKYQLEATIDSLITRHIIKGVKNE